MHFPQSHATGSPLDLNRVEVAGDRDQHFWIKRRAEEGSSRERAPQNDWIVEPGRLEAPGNPSGCVLLVTATLGQAEQRTRCLRNEPPPIRRHTYCWMSHGQTLGQLGGPPVQARKRR